MMLGRNLGKDLPGDSNSYPIQSALDITDSAQIGAVKIAHEFGHLDDFRSRGKTFFEEQSIINEMNKRQEELTAAGASPQVRATDKKLAQAFQKFQDRFGISIDQNAVLRDKRADRNAIPTIKQIVGRKKLVGEKQLMKEKL